jgi:hypothetical protein
MEHCICKENIVSVKSHKIDNLTDTNEVKV